MKNLKLIACSCLFLSFSALAQFDVSFGTFDVAEAFKVEIAAHNTNPVILDYVNDIEKKYAVSCSGFTTPDYPYVQSRMTYKADCDSETQKIKLKIKSKYLSKNGSFVFIIKKTSLKFKM